MSSASRSDLITSCSASLSLPATRSWSPWIRTWTLLDTFWMRLRRSRASSSLIPALSWSSICPRPLPTVFGSPALKSFVDSWRRTAFSRRTCRAARARSSLDDSITISVPRCSYVVAESLKSKRVWTSRRAWSSALVSSAGLYSETTSNEYSATGRGQDRVDAGDDGGHRESDADDGRDGKQGADAGGGLVERFGGRPVVGVRPVVEVVDAFRPRSLDELVDNGPAAGWQSLVVDVRHGELQVVPRPSELRDREIQRLHGRRRRVFAPEIRDRAVEAHVRKSYLPATGG